MMVKKIVGAFGLAVFAAGMFLIISCSGDGSSHAQKGYDFLLSGAGDSAVKYYQKALKKDKNTIDAYFGLGFIYCLKLDREFEGVAFLKKGLALSPDDPRLHYVLGMNFFFRGQANKSISHMEAAVRGMPDGLLPIFPPDLLYYNFGLALYGTGQCEKAALMLKKSTALKPEDPGFHYTLARALACRGDIDEALKERSLGVLLDSSVDVSGDLYFQLSQNYSKINQYEKAIECLGRAQVLSQREGDSTAAALIRRMTDSLKLKIKK